MAERSASTFLGRVEIGKRKTYSSEICDLGFSFEDKFRPSIGGRDGPTMHTSV